jgi:hypothetical protein
MGKNNFFISATILTAVVCNLQSFRTIERNFSAALRCYRKSQKGRTRLRFWNSGIDVVKLHHCQEQTGHKSVPASFCRTWKGGLDPGSLL